MRQPQHHRHIRIRAQGHPFSANIFKHVRFYGADIDNLDPRAACGQQGFALNMTAGAALTDLTVFQRHASETDEKLRVVPDHFPTCTGVQIRAKAAQDMRHHGLSSGETIGEF